MAGKTEKPTNNPTMGQSGPQSDLDLLVKFGKKKSLLEIVRTERELYQPTDPP